VGGAVKSGGEASCGLAAGDRRKPNGSLGRRLSPGSPRENVGGGAIWGTLGGARLDAASKLRPSLIERRIGGSLVRAGPPLGAETRPVCRIGGGAALSARPSHSIVPWHFLQRNLTNFPRMMWSATENFVLQLGQ
jgi:hypothetical protein